jgi:lipoprotein-anchoring transpeptidase ErfK/SrfK
MSNVARILLACLLVAFAAGWIPATASAHTHRAADTGGYMWAPERAPQGPVQIVISLSAQRAYVYRDGVRIGESPVSTGEEGRETPTGVFTILEKQRFHRSNRYDDAPMPYMQRITWAGVALHGGALPGYAASHGCIRLPHTFARKLFGVTSVGTQVVITDGNRGWLGWTGNRPRRPWWAFWEPRGG